MRHARARLRVSTNVNVTTDSKVMVSNAKISMNARKELTTVPTIKNASTNQAASLAKLPLPPQQPRLQPQQRPQHRRQRQTQHVLHYPPQRLLDLPHSLEALEV